jgi:flagellar hook-associated protein 1 FlgK
VGVNFSGGVASIVSQLNAALGSNHLQFSNPSGSTLRVVDDGTASVSVNAASATKTITSLASGNPQLPLFTDASSIYTGQITASGSELTGLAGRISVNAALLADPTKLSVYNTSPLTATGDTKRSDFLYAQLTSATFSYSPSTGIGSSAQPFQGTVTSYLQQFINQQSNASTLANQLQQGQSVVVSTLQQKFSSTASVNIDTEMSNLIAVQNAYAANAHIMSVVQSMMNTLLQAQV